MAFCAHIIQPKVEKCLIYDNVACRKGKGTHFGIMRLDKFLKYYYRKRGSIGYFLKCDVTKYFQNINHEILYNKLSKTSLDEEDLYIGKLLLIVKTLKLVLDSLLEIKQVNGLVCFILTKLTDLLKKNCK